MVLLQPIIQLRVGSMLDAAAHRFTSGPWIGRLAVRRHLIGNVANYTNGLLEKLLGRLHVPLLAQPRSNQIAILIDSPLHIPPRSMHLEVRFVNIPRSSCLSMSIGWYLLC